MARHGGEHGRTGHQSAGGPKFKPQPWKTRRDLLEQFEASLKKGREVLQKTTDDRLLNTNSLTIRFPAQILYRVVRPLCPARPQSRRSVYECNPLSSSTKHLGPARR